jgi:monoterpene epsilon-lactone hydrolase
MYRRIGALLSHSLNATVVLPAYRLAPEHPFPAPLQDAVATALWIQTSMRIRTAENLIVGGDSAGGGLTALLLLAIKEGRYNSSNLPQPGAYRIVSNSLVCFPTLIVPLCFACMIAGAFLLSPYTDLTFDYPSMQSNVHSDSMVSRAWLSAMRDLVAAASTSTASEHTARRSAEWSPNEPWYSPAHASDLSELAPIYVQSAESEVMRDDGVQFAAKVQAHALRAGGNGKAGVDGLQPAAVSEVIPGVHAMYLFDAFLPEGRDSIERVARWARAVLR